LKIFLLFYSSFILFYSILFYSIFEAGHLGQFVNYFLNFLIIFLSSQPLDSQL
jgi:hypothetical protein